jgi:hypothetical protein
LYSLTNDYNYAVGQFPNFGKYIEAIVIDQTILHPSTKYYQILFLIFGLVAVYWLTAG